MNVQFEQAPRFIIIGVGAGYAVMDTHTGRRSEAFNAMRDANTLLGEVEYYVSQNGVMGSPDIWDDIAALTGIVARQWSYTQHD